MNTKSATKQMDMLNGPLVKKILMFALPLAFSSILQQLFNAADTAIVGRFSGVDSLAAVGSNTAVCTLFIGAVTGTAVGTNVLLARRIALGEQKGAGSVVSTSIIFSMLFGILLMGLGIAFSRPLLTAIGAPENVMDQAVLYLRIYMLGIPFMSVYNFSAAIMRSIGNTKIPTICLLITGVLNVLLNLLFVIVFRLSVAGVAIATSISNVVGAVLIVIILIRDTGYIRLDIRHLTFSINMLGSILRIGIPAAIQTMVFSAANICIQGGINSFGTSAIAGSSAALNFEGFDFYLVTAFSQAAVTFIGQNYAAGKFDRVRKITRICLAESIIIMTCMIAVFYLGRDFWLSLFTTDPDAIVFGQTRMMIVLLPHMLICTYEVTGSVIRGLGRSLTPALITIIGSVALRVAWLLTIFKIYQTFECLMIVYPVSWIVTGTMMITAYILITRKLFPENKETTAVSEAL